EAEERGHGEAIARNIHVTMRLKVPVICDIIGEGARRGALGRGVGDRRYMMENTWYTVISPENCSTILWRSWDYKVQAAEQLKLTSSKMTEFGLIDGIIPEPRGGAHWDYKQAADNVKKQNLQALAELKNMDAEQRVQARIDKFCKMGVWEEL